MKGRHLKAYSSKKRCSSGSKLTEETMEKMHPKKNLHKNVFGLDSCSGSSPPKEKSL